MAETNKKKLKIASSSLLAVTMLGTTVGTNFANAEDAPAKDDENNKTEESKKASVPINVDNSKINKAVKEAKDTGVEVKKDKPKNHTVKSDEVDKTKEDIQKDYDKQIADIEKATKEYAPKKADYDKKNKAYQDAIKNPKFNSGKTEFTKKQLQDFLGKDPQNVTYVTGNKGEKKMKFDKGNLKTPSKAQLNERYGYSGEYGPHRDNDYSKPFLLKKGSTWTYKNALKNNKTGRDVDVKYTVTNIKIDKNHQFKSPVADVRTNELGVNMMTPIDEASFDVEYFDSETGKPVKLDALNGMGDLDGDQYYKLNTKMDNALKGSKVVKDGKQSWKAEGEAEYDTDDPSTQIWNIAKSVSKQNFTWGSRQQRNKDYHGANLWINGNIPFGLELPDKPTPPKKPTVNYNLHNLNVTPENHKDVEKGVQKEDTDASIDKEEVSVGDTVTYPLTNSDLPADRKDDIKSYVVKDELPEGVKPDEKEIKKNVDASKWDVKVDGQKVEYTATKDLLADMNKDKSKAYKVPTIGLVAKVAKGGDVNFDNTFDTIINDNTVKSNQVSNKAPEVTKSSLEKFIVEDGKLVKENKAKKGDDVNYRINYNIGNDKETKKVVFSDDLEDVLDINKDSVKVYALDDKDAQSDDAQSDDAKSNNAKADDNKDDVKADDNKDDVKADDNKDDAKADDNKDDAKADDNKDDAKADDNKDDAKADDDAKENDNKDDAKADDDAKENDNKEGEMDKVDIVPDDEKATGGAGGGEASDDDSEKAESNDDKSQEGQKAEEGKEITDQGELKVDEDKESFEWVAKDPESMKGKSFYVEVTGKAKTDADYSKYEKDDKATVPNVAKLTVDGDSMDSNEVKTEIPKEDPKKEEPQKDNPKKDPKEDPQEQPKDNPKKDPQEQPQAPSAKGNGAKPVPNTGGDGNFIDKIAQTFYNIFK